MLVELGIRILLANSSQALFAGHPSMPNGHGSSGSKCGEKEHHHGKRKEKVHAKNPEYK
jgi:hypothetical protein